MASIPPAELIERLEPVAPVKAAETPMRPADIDRPAEPVQHVMVVQAKAALQTLKADTVSALDVVAPPWSGEIPKTDQDRIMRVNELHQGMARLGVLALQKALECGGILWTVRQDCKEKGHGVWAAWMQKNLTFTEKTARRYLRLYENRDRIQRSLDANEIQDLSAAYKLLAMKRPKDSTKPATEESDKPVNQKDTAANTNEDCEPEEDEGQSDGCTGTESPEEAATAGSDEDEEELLKQRLVEVKKYLDLQWADCRNEDQKEGVIEVVYYNLSGWMQEMGLKLTYDPFPEGSPPPIGTLSQQES